MKRFYYFLILSAILFIAGCNSQNEEVTKDVVYSGFGAQETVSGSLHTLQVGNDQYIIDAGSFYGEGDNYPLPEEVNINNIEGVFITHAHADHIGRLPLLLHEGYSGPIYMTPITYDIAKISLESSIRYMDFGEETFYYSRNNESDQKPVYVERFSYGEFEVQEQNRVYIDSKREELDEQGFYLSSDTVDYLGEELLNKLDNQVNLIDFNEELPKDDLVVEFIHTSHLPGSAMIKFEIDTKNLLFTGDIGSDRSPFLDNNSMIDEPVDYIFAEGTYGLFSIENEGRESTYKEERSAFKQFLGEAVEKNKRIIIPAFVLDRTQQVLYEIKAAMEEGEIPSDTIVKAYSPTSEEITNLYSYYSNNEEKYQSYFSETMFTEELFNITNLIYNPRQQDSNLYDMSIEYGEIALMSSGMLSSAFSYEAVKNYIEDEDTVFVLVGYQDPDEIGGKLKHGYEEINIEGENYQINAEVFDSPAFSGHGDINQIYTILKQTNPSELFLVHLNADEGDLLKAEYEELFPDTEVFVPQYKEEYHLFSY